MMMNKRLHGLSYDDLRARLEKLCAETGATNELNELLHELEIHQVELEMQNRELRETQAVLEESRDRYAELYDGAPVGYLTLRASGTIREINLAAAALLGAGRHHLAGSSLVPWLTLTDRPRLLAFLRQTGMAQGGRAIDLRLITARAEERNVRLQALWTADPDDPGHLCRAALIDLTEQARTQAALGESERRFRTIFENAAVGMAEMSLDGRLLRVNHHLSVITGYEAEELTSRSCSDILHPADRAAQAVQDRRLQSGEIASYTLEKRLLKKDGGEIWVHTTAALLESANGPAERYITVVEDITARKRAEEALREADRRKDEFLMMLGHELRNPLAPVRNAAEVLRGEGALDPQQVHWAADVIARQAEHMTCLVDDLLDVSRITHGSIQLKKTPLDLCEAVERAAEQARPLLDERGQALELALPATPVVIHGDLVRLAQVVANLLVNASKFSPRGSRVALALSEAGGEARLRVCDEGMGIHREQLASIFEPFMQATQPRDRAPGGLGLGLALARGLARLHGGELTADSAGPDQGSTFTLRLPLPRPAPIRTAPKPAPSAKPAPVPLPQAAPPEAAPAGGSKVILIVDDNRDVAESSAMLLELAGHQVRAVGDGEAALAAVEELGPDVILLDIGLPGMDGFEVARRLRQSPAGARATLVAVSGYDLANGPNRERAAIFDGHLLKPVGLKTLLATIERCQRPPPPA